MYGLILRAPAVGVDWVSTSVRVGERKEEREGNVARCSGSR
jgi:hypothetical protein